MNKLNLMLYVTVLGLFTLPYTNCSDVQFAPSVEKSIAEATDSNDGLDIIEDDDRDQNPEDNDHETPPAPTPEEAITNCASAQAAGTLKTVTHVVIFEDTKVQSGRSQVCEFDKGDNLSQRNNELRARYEQLVDLDLPADAVLCDLQMQTHLQRFKYDDTFFLMFNDRILASNLKSGIHSRLNPESYIDVAGVNNLPIYKFDWLNLRTAGFENVANDYCLGKEQGLGDCSWPVSEQNGKIEFEFHRDLLTHLGLKANSNQQKFTFVTTGDDDESLDCYHEKLEFVVDIQYYEN